jgi:hypothetical protein
MAEDLNKQMVRWTRALSIATIVIAVATAFSGFFILKQWQSVTDAQSDSREQLRAYVTFDRGTQNSTRTRDIFSGRLSITYLAGIFTTPTMLSRPRTNEEL